MGWNQGLRADKQSGKVSSLNYKTADEDYYQAKSNKGYDAKKILFGAL